jgi:amino acid adenylation domain-containing protein
MVPCWRRIFSGNAYVLPLDHGGPVERPFERFPPDALAGSVPDRFDAIVRRFPDRLAISDAALELTYRALGDRVGRIAHRLLPTLPPGDAPVGILLGQGARFPVAMLGVLKAGRGYVPLDASFPVERNRLIVSHAGVCAVVTDAEHRAAAAGLVDASVPVVDMDGADAPGPVTALPTARAGDLAYVIYTSGSTGTPKGVFQNHANLLHDVMQYCNAIHLSAEDRLSLLYSPSVNGAIRDIYGALLSGASLHVVSPKRVGAEGLHQFLRGRRVTVYHSVPIVFRHLTAQMPPDQVLESVRLVYLAGDRLDRGDLLAFRRHLPPGALLYTGVGSTEVATIYAHWFISHATPLPDGRVPVGRAIPDRRFELLDEADQPVPAGQAGEIEVSGRNIALGYWRDPAATARAFVVDPAEPDVRRHRTGDLGRLDADGMLVHLGRKDHQIKLRGHRIELVEIEAALKAHPGVAEAAVLVRGGEADSVLVAYWVATGDGTDADALRAFLLERLPTFMVPPLLVQTQALPLLPNFKLDRAALAQHDRAAAAVASLPPRMPDAVADIAAAFAQVLRRPVGPDDDFFLLGGDSLGATRVALELEKRLGRRVPEGLLGFAQTPRLVLAWAEAVGRGQPQQLVELHANRAGLRPPVLLMSGLDGTFTALQPLVAALPRGHNYLGVLDRSVVVPGVPSDRLPDIAAEAIDAIRAAGIGGPFRLLGHSFGGRLAYEVAHQLATGGEHVSFLGLIDTPAWVEQQPSTTSDPVTLARRLATTAYLPPRLDLPVTFFRAVASWPDKPDDYFWSRHAPAVRAIRVPGTHATFHRPPHLAVFLTALEQALDAAERVQTRRTTRQHAAAR